MLERFGLRRLPFGHIRITVSTGGRSGFVMRAPQVPAPQQLLKAKTGACVLRLRRSAAGAPCPAGRARGRHNGDFPCFGAHAVVQFQDVIVVVVLVQRNQAQPGQHGRPGVTPAGEGIGLGRRSVGRSGPAGAASCCSGSGWTSEGLGWAAGTPCVRSSARASSASSSTPSRWPRRERSMSSSPSASLPACWRAWAGVRRRNGGRPLRRRSQNQRAGPRRRSAAVPGQGRPGVRAR